MTAGAATKGCAVCSDRSYAITSVTTKVSGGLLLCLLQLTSILRKANRGI